MINTILLSLAIVALAMILLGIKVFFTKNGEFPNTHIEGNKALREKGIHCIKTQDRQARTTTSK